MAYYAALLSLKHTVRRITDSTDASDLPRLPLIDRLHKEVDDALQYFGEKSIISSRRTRIINSSGKKNALDDEMREAIHRLEDLLEAQAESIQPYLRNSDQSLGCDYENNSLNLPLCYEELVLEILSFIAKITEMKDQYKLLRELPPEPAVSSAYSPKTNFFTEDKSELVGLQDELDELKQLLLLTHERDPTYTRKRKGNYIIQLPEEERDLMAIIIVGMAGIGKTTLAKKVCEDTEVRNCFDCRLFVPVGQVYMLEEVLLRILTQFNQGTDGDNNINQMQNNQDLENLKYYVSGILKQKRYIIVFDDVWEDKFLWDELKRILPNNLNGSRVMLTTRVENHVVGESVFRKRFLDKAESWNLLRKKVFDTDRYPYQHEKFGEKIAEKCEGLPLAIISVRKHLAKTENRSIEYWESVADKGIANIICADDEVYKVLHRSYEYLRENEKSFFLYFGVFHQGCEIVASKLIKLWIAEGIIDNVLDEKSQEIAQELLVSFRKHNLVMVKHQQKSSFESIKISNLHIVYWCYCKTRASKEKFYQILNAVDDCFIKGIESQRRLCIHNNTLFGIKDSYESITSLSNLRSLLCTGPYHKYPIPFCFSLMLLRVLDVVSIRFFLFPFQVLKLVRLRYIALMYDGDLPPSISQLINLWYLIVRRHVRVISPKSPSYLPLEIWDMKELRHLQVEGSDLQEPPANGASLVNLEKLLDVTPQSCSQEVLQRIPNIRKLGVQIVLPVDSTEPLISLDYIRELNDLESLKLDVVNPKPSSRVAAGAYPTSIFPAFLKSLSLSGFGYSWAQMSEISRLTFLEKLKLRHCAFQGPSWDVQKEEFRFLQFLLLEDIDLRYWNRTDSNSFEWLRHFTIRHCYNLERIPFKTRGKLAAIEIVDCKPSVADSVEILFLNKEVFDLDATSPDVFLRPTLVALKWDTLVVSSWED